MVLNPGFDHALVSNCVIGPSLLLLKEQKGFLYNLTDIKDTRRKDVETEKSECQRSLLVDARAPEDWLETICVCVCRSAHSAFLTGPLLHHYLTL